MFIRHKGIEHGIYTDAPFIGSRISAISCSKRCPGCFNQGALDYPDIVQKVSEIIQIVRESKISKGIILGGLEWTEQPAEMLSLISYASMYGMEIMLYTHLSIDHFIARFPQLAGIDMYIKCGEYVRDSAGYKDASFDVYLASSNQKIYRLKEIT